MNGKARVWFLSVFFFIPLLYADSQYECGAHGRFEYCIDGVPGCVIGCHCHPGYYFDTDTKICEPNIKLTHSYRRGYPLEPTRMHDALITAVPEEQTKSTTPNAVDEKIDEITKDADDLGDWLYNQFFKTIENQVINKTQGEELPPTRRSGNILLNKPSRRSHKYWNGRKKKKRRSKGLKGKLLRITEDDSLFNSDSHSSSNEDETSSSSESDVSHSGEDKKKKDDHGHKKIIIFNKKPQPPLPSFIFLPNMDTPYYPPIGLPPPPAMPMYPMVPVPPMLPGPPMGGPLFPFPGVPATCDEDDVSTSTATSSLDIIMTTAFKTTPEPVTQKGTETTKNEESTKTEETTKNEESTKTEETTKNEATTTEDPPAGLRFRHKKRNKSIGRPNNGKRMPIDPAMRQNRNKLLQKLREKLNRKNKLESYYADQFEESDAPDLNDPSELFVSKQNFMMPNMNEMPPPPDVDFKYLAELIHKADLNKTLNTQAKPNQLNIKTPNTNAYQKQQPQNKPETVPVETPSRRSFYPNVNTMIRQRSRMEDPNDSFYTNLGKQIASMIRKIDQKGEREVNIEIEGGNSKHQSQTSPVFNENNYASRSFWERSVRSPLKFVKHGMDYIRQSNEDLYSLENQVQIAASTVRTLSLQDLENIIKTVDKVQIKPKRRKKLKPSVHSNSSFKLNLLPRNVQTGFVQPLPKPKPTLRPKPMQNFIHKDSDNIYKPTKIIQPTRRNPSDINNFLLSNFRQLAPDYDDPLRTTGSRKDLLENSRPTRKPTASGLQSAIRTFDSKTIEPLPKMHRFHNIMPSVKGTESFVKAENTNLKYQLSPVLMNHRNIYYSHNKNAYLFDNALPIQYTGLTKSVPYGQDGGHSYFPHDFQNFDYFEK